MNKQAYVDKLNSWNESIRSGDKAFAYEGVLSLDVRDIPREHAVDFADIARRVGLFLEGLKILRPHMEGKGAERPTQKELKIWAALLIKLGSIDEALAMLERLDKSDPQAILFTSFAHVSRWDYEKAATLQRQYLAFIELDPYQRTIGQINLGAAYVSLQKGDKATGVLSEALAAANENDWRLLRSNALELLAGAAILEEKWDDAKFYLSEASQLVTRSPLDTLLIRKMSTIIELRQPRSHERAVSEMENLRREALELRHWETVRDCQFHLSLANKDADRAALVYFGSPFPPYRKQILKAAKDFFDVPESYRWSLASGSHSPQRYFDLSAGREIDGSASLEAGGLVHRFFIALSSDFFRPQFVGTLFSQIYPGEHFDPASSPARITRLVSRLREWFDESHVPLGIEVDNLTYRLTGTGSYGLVVYDKPLAPKSKTESAREDAIKKLRELRPYQSFSSKDAAELLEIPPRTIQSYLTWAVQNRKVRASGTGRSLRYHFAK